MNKKRENAKKILEFVRNNNGISSTEIGKYMNITTVSAYHYLDDLLWKNLIYKTGLGKNTRYFYMTKKIHFNKDKLVEETLRILEDVYEFSLKKEEIIHIFERNFCYLDARNGELSYGIQAFILWCQDPKRNFRDEIIPKEWARYIVHFLDMEALRRKSGFFDGTESMRKILAPYTDIFIDKMLFCHISEISGFGRTRTAMELYYGKQNSDMFLIGNAIQWSIEPIRQYISQQNIDTIIFTPPTIARPVQFSSLLKTSLALSLQEILVSKVKGPDKTLIAQKFTKWAERIINAQSSITIEKMGNTSSMKHILILDDNFTTGATVNAIAKKLRLFWYTGKITAITITGKFHYDAIVDVDEI